LKVTIKVVKELPDGSADVELNYDEEALAFMIERGINALLVEAIMTKETGELYGISDVLGTIPKKSRKGRSNQGVAKIKAGGTD